MTSRTWLPIAAVLLLAAPAAHAAPEKRLDEQLKVLATDLKASLTIDPKLKGRAVALGLFNGPKLRGSNFGNRIERALAAELTTLLVEKAELTLLGRYDYVESAGDTAADDPNFHLRVLKITAVIEDAQGRQLDTKVIEVNDTDDIAAALGLTVQPPFNGGQKARNEAGDKAFQAPQFFVRNRTQISDAANSPYSVEVRVKSTPDGAGTPLAPQNQKGHAFVDIKPTQFYELRLYNDEPFEASAAITIDGLDALNTFNEDKVKYRSYIIPPRSSILVRGWLHTVEPREKEKDNVFAFLVTEYGHGAASRLKSTGQIGVITVQFAAAWKPGKKEPEHASRGTGRETDKGPGLPESLKVEPWLIGDRRSTISVRYSPGN